MSFEPPAHTWSVNSFFQENLYLSIPDVQMGPQTMKGLEPSMG